MYELDGTSATIPTKALASIGIEKYHGKIKDWVFPYQDQSVCTDSEFTVTNIFDDAGIFCIKILFPVIDDDEIIPGTLVFMKFNLIQTDYFLR